MKDPLDTPLRCLGVSKLCLRAPKSKLGALKGNTQDAGRAGRWQSILSVGLGRPF